MIPNGFGPELAFRVTRDEETIDVGRVPIIPNKWRNPDLVVLPQARLKPISASAEAPSKLPMPIAPGALPNRSTNGGGIHMGSFN